MTSMPCLAKNSPVTRAWAVATRMPSNSRTSCMNEAFGTAAVSRQVPNPSSADDLQIGAALLEQVEAGYAEGRNTVRHHLADIFCPNKQQLDVDVGDRGGQGSLGSLVHEPGLSSKPAVGVCNRPLLGTARRSSVVMTWLRLSARASSGIHRSRAGSH